MFEIFKNLFAQTDKTQLMKAIKDGAFLVDVRTSAEFSSGSAKGAVNIPLNNVPGKLNIFEGKEIIVVFCQSGNRSAQAKTILEQNGFQNIINGGTWRNVSQITNG